MMKFSVLIIGIFSYAWSAQAMQSQVLSVRSKAYFTPSSEGLYQALDLKKRQVIFQTADFDKCGQDLLRTAKSLQFQCKLSLPTKSAYNRLKSQITVNTLQVRFGGTQKVVTVRIHPSANEVTFTTEFDSTGIDFELTHFNDEMIKVYSKVAQLVIAQAMQNNPLVYEDFESSI